MLITYDRNCQQCSLLCLRDQYYRTRETLVLEDQGGTSITGPGRDWLYKTREGPVLEDQGETGITGPVLQELVLQDQEGTGITGPGRDWYYRTRRNWYCRTREGGRSNGFKIITWSDKPQ